MEMKDALLVLLLPIIAALISSYLTYYFAIKQKKSEAILEFKEEKYANLLVLLQGFVGTTVSAETNITSRGSYPDPEKGRKAVGDIVIAMREDLLGKTALSPYDFRYIDVIEDK